MKTIVIGLGGNALLGPGKSQKVGLELRNAERAACEIAKIAKTGKYNIVITHGNGPQVGDEQIKNSNSRKAVPELPLYMLNAETEASIGTVLETALRNELKRLHIEKEVCVMLTHTVVDKKDRAFLKPTKPIGPFYSKDALLKELKFKKFDYIRVGDRYRMVVPSPAPVSILEADAIKSIAGRAIVIAAGGGGVPVLELRGRYVGANAVIDKDMTTQLLANLMGAFEMVILTDVDRVYRDFENRRGAIGKVRAKELNRLLDTFEEGTMRPKIKACVKFIENGGKIAHIGSLYRLSEVLKGTSGTTIVA
jgi:carbamate kinase